MRLLVCLVCLGTLPGFHFSENTDGVVDDSVLKEIIFPKDRLTSLLGPRIIGGEEASPHSFPYQAALYIYMTTFNYFCGGTLISPSWVLTAAHCLSENPLFVLVVLGSHNMTVQEPSRLILNSTTWVYHDNWNNSILHDDIGLVKLPINVTLGENITTIRYARGRDNLFTGEVGTIVGWGLTEEGGNTVSPVLRHVNVSIIENEKCDNIYTTVNITSTHLCTSGTGTVGSCSGDSGGPLIVDGVQVGIVSFGASDCTLGAPSVFARLTHYTEWIEQYVTDGSHRNLECSLVILMMFCTLQLIISL